MGGSWVGPLAEGKAVHWAPLMVGLKAAPLVCERAALLAQCLADSKADKLVDNSMQGQS